MELKDIKTLLIDGDGVLYHHSTPSPGFVPFFEALKSCGIQWALVTNNSTATVQTFTEKLREFGAEVDESQIITSAMATTLAMQEEYPEGTPFYVIGEDGIRSMLTEAGFKVYTGEEKPQEEIPAVIVGWDRQITYGRLSVATQLIWAGAEFIGTNPDRTFPSLEGPTPGTGSILWALTGATYKEPRIIGKPKSAIYEFAMESLGADAGSTAMLGDRMETDIFGGINAGLGTILVLSGIESADSYKEFDFSPDWVFEDIAELAEALTKAG